MKTYLTLIVLAILNIIFGIVIGYVASQQQVFIRQQEVVKEHNRSNYGYDRYDLHYITFGEKI